MKTVWKVGCRWSDWGDPNTEIADSVFFRYGIAFANTHAVLDARAGHLIALANGYTIVAIGEIIGTPQRIEKLNIVLSKEDRIKFFNDDPVQYEANDDGSNVCGCHVQYYILDEKDRFQYNKAGRFFHATGIEQRVNDLFDKLSRGRR